MNRYQKIIHKRTKKILSGADTLRIHYDYRKAKKFAQYIYNRRKK